MSRFEEEEDTDVTDLPLRPPAPAEVRDLPRDPESGAPVRSRRPTRPYRLVGGRVVLDIWTAGGEP